MCDFSVMENCAGHVLQRMNSNRDSTVARSSLGCVSGTTCCVYKYGTLWNILLRTVKLIPRITKREGGGFMFGTSLKFLGLDRDNSS